MIEPCTSISCLYYLVISVERLFLYLETLELRAVYVHQQMRFVIVLGSFPFPGRRLRSTNA